MPVKDSFRVERDAVGEMPVPEYAYYGVQSLRASQNFPITLHPMHPVLIANLARVKKACARANVMAGELDPEIGRVIVAACDEILNGQLSREFIVDAIQGGAGTSANMNVNEVIANRAGEMLGGKKGEYKLVHPNDHVNRSQSTNDVFPTAGRLAVIELLNPFIEALQHLIEVQDKKAAQFNRSFKMGRTEMQDAVPMRIGQAFAAVASALRRDIAKIRDAESTLYVVNLGGTAIGTGINASPTYRELVVEELSKVCGVKLRAADNLIDATQNLDDFVDVSSAIKSCAVTLNKWANDLRLLSSGPATGFGEINLPPVQAGSSIMPGKINPVIPEAVNQVAFNCIGNDLTVTLAAANGQLELNAFEPLLFYKLFETLDTMTNILGIFADQCIAGITVNEDSNLYKLEKSTYLATVVSPILGYRLSSDLAKEALRTGRSMRNLILEKKLMDEKTLNEIADLDKLC